MSSRIPRAHEQPGVLRVVVSVRPGDEIAALRSACGLVGTVLAVGRTAAVRISSTASQAITAGRQP